MTHPDVAESWLDDWLDEHLPNLIRIRRHLRAHPEVSGYEVETSRLITEHLHRSGITSRAVTGEVGVIADLPGHRQRRIALRADLDALPIDDLAPVPYRSTRPGVAHACGHDVHTTILLGTAQALADPSAPKGASVRCIFQSAEERVPGGAIETIEAGALDEVDEIYGLHCDPTLSVGTVGLRVGPITSITDMAQIILTGPGGHTARPDQTIDLIAVAARLIAGLPKTVATLLDGPAPTIVFGAVHGGDAPNVIPDQVELRCTIRSRTTEHQAALPTLIERAVAQTIDDSGAGVDVAYRSGHPVIFNDASLIERARLAATGSAGMQTTDVSQSLGGDDFGWYTQTVPGAYLRLGSSPLISATESANGFAATAVDLHAGTFDVDEDCVAFGIRLWVALALGEPR